MIVLKILGIGAGFVALSIYLVIIIGAGVSTGLKSYFDRHQKDK